MADRLTKRQRIYAREQLAKKQNGKCYFCGVTLRGFEGHPRAALGRSTHGKLILGCQPCVCRPPADPSETEAVDLMIA